MADAREVRELLDERPDLEPALESVLEPEPPWDFGDIDVESGRFGELVGRGLVEKTDDGYRVSDPAVIERVLHGEMSSSSEHREFRFPSLSIPINRPEVGSLIGALVLVVALRLVSWPTVFREGHVVLSGNDPYFYRYHVESLLQNPNFSLSNLPNRVAKGEPLYIAAIWVVSIILGGTQQAAGYSLALYPVIAGGLTAAIIYVTASLITDDRRIGLAAVLMLAVLPGHAFRTGLGFADHHPFDYLWLAVTLLGLALIAFESHRERWPLNPRAVIGGLAILIGVTAQTLSWDNSPIILAALAPYIAFEALRAVHTEGDPPINTLGPIISAIAGASILTWFIHDQLGWHTELVTYAPLLTLIGSVGILLGGELSHRLRIPAIALAGIEVIIGGGLAYGFKSVRPEEWTRLIGSIEGRLLADRPIAEVQSIFSDSFGWLLLFGFILLLAFPYLLWATRRALEDARWLPPVTYAWYFLVLSTIQARFVGELAPVLAIFAGFGLVHFSELIDVSRRPAPFGNGAIPNLRIPDRRPIGYLALLFLLIAGLSIVQVPVMTTKVTTPTELSDTAFYLEEYSDERNLEYPQNYVFSEWGKNRVYNYFVSGESRSYRYAQANYEQFVVSTDPGAWYDRLSGRTGFVVTTAFPELEPAQTGAVLHRDNGSRTGNHPGVAHYRLIYVSENGRYKAFELVEGAILTGQAAPDSTVTAKTNVDVPGGSFTYSRQTTTNGAGNYSLRVAHPGTYNISGTTVMVPGNAIRNGTSVTVQSHK